MQRNTFKIVFFCKKTKINKKGKAPIYVRITTDGVSTEIFTKCQIEPEHWNQRAERSLRRDKVDEQINNIITTFRCNILAVYDQLIKEGKNPTCQAIKLRLANPYEETRAFLAEFSKYAEKRQGEIGTRIVKRTAEKYFRMLRYLREYTTAKYKSVFDGFQNSLSMWLSKYVSVYLWLPISDLFSAIIARLQTLSLQNDAELAATGYDWYFDSNSTIYLVFMLVAICGYFCIPSIASWVVQTNGIGSYNRAVGTMAALGGGVVGYSAGRSWSTTKAGGRGLAKFGKFLFTKSE